MVKPIELSSEELRRSVSETLKRVAYAGDQFVITLYGKPVARILPIEDKGETKKKPKPLAE